jgi:hypothetical protein
MVVESTTRRIIIIIIIVIHDEITRVHGVSDVFLAMVLLMLIYFFVNSLLSSLENYSRLLCPVDTYSAVAAIDTIFHRIVRRWLFWIDTVPYWIQTVGSCVVVRLTYTYDEKDSIPSLAFHVEWRTKIQLIISET